MNELDVLLSDDVSAAHERGRKQSVTFYGRVFYSYALLLFRDLNTMHSTPGKKQALSFDAFLSHLDFADEGLLTAGEESQLEHSESFLLQPSGQEKKFSCSRQGPRPTRCLCKEKHCSLGEVVVPLARAAERSPLLSLQETLAFWESVPAPSPVDPFFDWLSECRRTRKTSQPPS